MRNGHQATSTEKVGVFYCQNPPSGCSPEHQKMIAHLPEGGSFLRRSDAMV